MRYLYYNGKRLEYTLIKKRKKTITIKITLHGEIVVTAPINVEDKYIEDFIKSKVKWIMDKLEIVNKLIDFKEDFKIVNGETIDFLGQKLILKISEDNVDKIKILKQDYILNIIVPVNFDIYKNQETLKQEINRWLKEQAKVVLKQRVEFFSQKYNLIPNRLVIKEQKTIWGSCSSKGNINLNWRLIMTPIDVLDYVVVHELCHLKHHNHSNNFWNLVKDIMPNYDDKRTWLKENGWRLFNY